MPLLQSVHSAAGLATADGLATAGRLLPCPAAGGATDHSLLGSSSVFEFVVSRAGSRGCQRRAVSGTFCTTLQGLPCAAHQQPASQAPCEAGCIAAGRWGATTAPNVTTTVSPTFRPRTAWRRPKAFLSSVRAFVRTLSAAGPARLRRLLARADLLEPQEAPQHVRHAVSATGRREGGAPLARRRGPQHTRSPHLVVPFIEGAQQPDGPRSLRPAPSPCPWAAAAPAAACSGSSSACTAAACWCSRPP